ncbi:MAG: Lin0512 family protein [Pseudomonadota bacterium]
MHTKLIEYGQGSSLRQQDYTQAAVRAVENALWRNSIDLAGVFGVDRAAMRIRAEIGVQNPSAVDPDKVAAIFPYGTVAVSVVPGGLDIPKPDGGVTVLALAALHVSLDGVA